MTVVSDRCCYFSYVHSLPGTARGTHDGGIQYGLVSYLGRRWTTMFHFLNSVCSTPPDTAGHGPDIEYYMVLDHPGRLGSPRGFRTSSSPAAARQDINDPRVTVSTVSLLRGCAAARTAGTRREGARWVRRTIAAPREAKRAR